jgi:hypothetical protein
MERNMDESRKQFEEWAQGIMEFAPDDLTWDEYRNCYRNYVPHMAWKSWQASRAAIEIRLPTELQLKKYACSDCISVTLDEVENGIRAAGIKVKE